MANSMPVVSQVYSDVPLDDEFEPIAIATVTPMARSSQTRRPCHSRPCLPASFFAFAFRGHVPQFPGDAVAAIRVVVGRVTRPDFTSPAIGLVHTAATSVSGPGCIATVFAGIVTCRKRDLTAGRVGHAVRAIGLVPPRKQVRLAGHVLHSLAKNRGRSTLLVGRLERNAEHRRAVRLGPDVRQDVAAEEDAGESVVVRRGDRVELVIVAAGARQRQAQKRAADHVDLIVRDVGEQLLLVRVAAAPVAEREQPGAR